MEMWDFRLPFVGIGAAGGAGIDGRQGLNTNGKVSGINAGPTAFCGRQSEKWKSRTRLGRTGRVRMGGRLH